jgi:hypothetical protein
VSFARQDAPDPARSALRSLRPSLNRPVVVVEDLPAGPAMAVIAGLAAPAGSQVWLAIRSERSGQVVFFGSDAEPPEWGGADPALEAAFTFAESMGFLFEDDRLAQAPGEARRLWEALLEGAGRAGMRHVDSRPRPPEEPPAASQEELWLELVSAPAPAIARCLPLTKFRPRSAGGAWARPRGSAAVPARAPLARFRIGPERRSP